MPNRILRDGILTSEAVSLLSWGAEVFYRRVMSVADDYGRFYATPKLIRAACYPQHIDKVSDADIGKWLTECVTAALVSVYPASDGKRYIQIEKFGQQIRAKSKFPDPLESTEHHSLADASNQKQPLANGHLDGDVDGDVDGDDKEHDSPNGESSASPDGAAPAQVDPIPYKAIVAGYNRELVNLTKVRELTPKRRSLIRSAWLASPDRRSLDFWAAYWAECQADEFLNGTGPYREPHANWRPGFDYLLRADVVTRTFERALDRLEKRQ